MNLNRLELNRASAEGLKTIILQRHIIRRIHLNIELPSYACRRCQRVSGLWEPAKLIKKALRKLSGALETWEPTDRITLELNKTWDDPKHGWAKGKQVTLPNAASILQLFETISPEIAAGAKPAQVPAVKGIVIRRQMRRRINPSTLCILLERFPNVESIDYEPWRVLCHSLDENGWIYGRHDLMMQVLLRKLPQHVRSVTIFEDFNEQTMEAIRNDMDPSIISMSMQIETRRFTRSELGEAFAVKSRDLEHLSVAFMIDARDFLRSCKMLSDWPRLRSLILTAPIMTKGSRDSISGLLVNTGEVAQQMLHSKSLTIWHCSREKACAVIFHKNEREDRNGHDSATLTWRGTRDFDFSKEVVETWQKVVLHMIERVEDEIISHGDAIHHLRLPDGVIDPTSLRQILQEGTLQREAWAVEAEPSGWT
ncbi:SNF1 protein kinase subunit beta-2 [Fusarium oxysporum f. sp. albedinis]|nr:SNF1 protein kinase subunit beta-2 [Fusarium oxysporum f. sp. albedinis]